MSAPERWKKETSPGIVVVGAGVLGLAIATALAAKGANVTVVDKGAPVGGTSGTSFAWVNSNGKAPHAYHALNAEGLRRHAAWQRDLPPALQWFRRAGAFEWAGGGAFAELERRVKVLQAIGYAADIVEAEQARRANPGLRVPGDVVAAFSEEGYVEVARFAAWALLKLRDAGARLAFGQAVARIGPAAGGVSLWLENGEEIAADRLVLATGRWTRPTLHELGYDFAAPDPLASGVRVRSLLAYTAALPVQLQSLIFTDRLNLRPDGGGRLVLQSAELDAFLADESEIAANGAFAQEFRRRLGDLLPFLPHDAIRELRIGRRSLTDDRLPAIGWIDGSIYLAVTHSGVTLAPVIADIAAAEILAEEESDALADFRPRRLLNPAQAVAKRTSALHSAQ
ncbi:MAG: NAD(P)/FAD-dependent oxidoreductase [Pseudochelatococcus sp.]|jgi:glycine/D-amino acid oxidase-like deaminating enzyme|uniref:NAD(P)/FAD-dependent oxidoreductase n=1 Tax=Pseudochelatococcus sp. TaxID=2020869 RepID=UPI003D8E4DA4